MDNIGNLIKEQFEKRLERGNVSTIKINLYKGYEVEAVAAALKDLSDFGDLRFPDCIMVADSYLTTHLWRSSTRLSNEELNYYLPVFLDLVHEVRIAIDNYFRNDRIYLVADMPDGSYHNIESAIRNTERMIKHGANVVKIEISTIEHFRIIEKLTHYGVCVMAHIGFTPQTGVNRVYGNTYEDAMALFAAARQARDCGSTSVVIERVNEIANQSLCSHRDNAIPVYSVFSGKARYGGQSLNVWDSVIRPPFKAIFFPPTATFNFSDFPEIYTPEIIKEKFSKLLRLMLTGDFPRSPVNKLSFEETLRLMEIDPWRSI